MIVDHFRISNTNNLQLNYSILLYNTISGQDIDQT